MKWLVALFVLSFFLFSGCLNFPTAEKVCPDGAVLNGANLPCAEPSISRLNLDPAAFPSTTLVSGQMNYVAAGGRIKTVIEIQGDEDIHVSLTDSYSPAFDDFSTQELFWLTNKGGKDLNVTAVNDSFFLLDVPAPKIPGNYRFGMSKTTLSQVDIPIGSYNLTVLGAVGDDNLAYAIADRFMYSKISKKAEQAAAQRPKYIMIQNWRFAGGNVTPVGDAWNVSLEVFYDKCDIDWNANDCIRNNTVTGDFIIDKKTGQIIG